MIGIIILIKFIFAPLMGKKVVIEQSKVKK